MTPITTRSARAACAPAAVTLALALAAGMPTAQAQERPAEPPASTEPAEPAAPGGPAQPAEPRAATEDPTQRAARPTAVTARMVTKVIHPDDARKAILEALEAKGGYPLFVSDERLRLKVPPGAVDELIDAVAAEGYVLEKGLDREDLAEGIAQIEGKLRSKLDIFARLRTFLSEADAPTTLKIEKTMATLVQEIEALKGQLRVLRDRASWAVLDVSFRFERRDRPGRVSSPFPWLNTVDLDRFLGEF